MLVSRRLVALFTALLLATNACASSSSSAPSAPPATRAPAPTATPGPTATPRPTSIAVLPGEPWLVYGWAAEPGGWYLALMRPDGSDVHKILTDVPGEHKSASWSPDGRTLAFVVQDSDHPEGSIWTANADGSGAALLSGGGTECPVGLFHPAWSPDGTKLAVVCYPGGSEAEGVAILDLATGSITRLFTVTQPQAINNQSSWSPDGTSIAFEILRWDATGQFLDGSLVATVSAAGGQVQRLTNFDTFMSHPDWRPDGREIVIGSNNPVTGSGDRSSNVYVIRPDGTGLRQITHSSVDGVMRIGCPRWDPDGSRIVVCIFTRDAIDTSIFDVRLGFVDADGGEPVLISMTDGKYARLRPTP
jgi:Tol biopolymer transport system component